MERYCSTGQSPQRAVAPTEEEEEENAAVRLNKMCRIKQVKPNNMNIKINGNKSQDRKTTYNAIRYRINKEIKFLYWKKQTLNQHMYHIHLNMSIYCIF